MLTVGESLVLSPMLRLSPANIGTRSDRVGGKGEEFVPMRSTYAIDFTPAAKYTVSIHPFIDFTELVPAEGSANLSSMNAH